MKGWVDLVDLIAPRPGVEPATFRSRVQRSTNAITKTTQILLLAWCRCGSTAVVSTVVPTLCGCMTASGWRPSVTSSWRHSTTGSAHSVFSAPETAASKVIEYFVCLFVGLWFWGCLPLNISHYMLIIFVFIRDTAPLIDNRVAKQ